MRTDLSQAFLDELAKESRHPVTLCEFEFPDGIRYLSDQPFGTEDGFPHNYEPLVANWGDLRDNVRIEPIVGGNSLEVRQMEITIINMGDSPFSHKFKNINPENVKVKLYQWFSNLPVSEMVLIDIFVCQDPITVSEAQSLVRIQLVSPIMAKNPFIWGPNKFLEARYPMILGKWQVVAKSMETGPTAILIYDIDQNFTGEAFIENSTGDWPTPPFNVYIDSEQVTVNSMAVSKMNITARGQASTVARPHIRGALVCDPTAQYDYSLTAGPVSAIENILGDQEAYNNPYTVFPGQDPAIIRFDGRPPWHRVEAGAPGEPIIPDPESTTQYGASSEAYSEIVASPSAGNINNASSNVSMSFDNTVGSTAVTSALYGNNTTESDPDDKIDVSSPGNVNNTNTNYATMTSKKVFANGDRIFFGARFGQDLSYLGTFVSAKVSIYVRYHSSVSYGYGLDNWIQTECNGYVLAKRRLSNNTRRSWTDTKDIPTANVGSWSELQNAVAGINYVIDEMPTTTPPVDDVETPIGYVRWTITYLANDNPTYPVQEAVSHFNRDLSSLGAFVSCEVTVRFDCASINCNLSQSIVTRTNNNQVNNSTLWSRNITSAQGMTSFKVYPSISSMASLRDTRVGVRHKVNSPANPGDRRYATTNIAYVQWKITYQPGAIDQPDEERVVYVTTLTADVTSIDGANITPATAIRNLLEKVGGLAEYVDQTGFDEYHAIYDAAQYYFNGLIDGETRFHAALKELIRQGSTRIAYNAGKIKLVSSFVESLEPLIPYQDTIEMVRKGGRFSTTFGGQTIQYIFKEDQRQRSATEQRMRFDDVANKITIRYKPDYKLEEWLGKLVVDDQDSISYIGEQEETFDYPYVSNDEIINVIGTRLLESKGSPKGFDTFRVYTKAFPFEKSDKIYVETDFNDYYGVVGTVMTINRKFGSGKDGRMNIFEVTLLATPIIAHRLNISDIIEVHGHFSTELVIVYNLLVKDVINVSDSLVNEAILTQTLKIAEQIQLSDNYGMITGSPQLLNISETINIGDSLSSQVVLPIILNISDQIQVSDSFSSENFTQFNLLIQEQVNIQDVIQLDSVTGYGVGGYGEGGYGGAII